MATQPLTASPSPEERAPEGSLERDQIVALTKEELQKLKALLPVRRES